MKIPHRRLGVPTLWFTAGLTATLLAGCNGLETTSSDPADFIPMAVKPPHVTVPERDEADETGPPPWGYYRIVGSAVPETLRDPGPATKRYNPLSWSPIGPRPISNEYWAGNANASGRVIGLAPHPTNANICYISAASGGVWKTTNGGTNWTPLTDELPTTNGGAISLDPSNPDVVYYGTGEWQQGSQGDGLYRSTDAGASWVRIATVSQTGNQISGVGVAPGNPALVHVTSTGGYSRSTNGGVSWTKPLTGNCSALTLDPSNANIVYVAQASGGVWKSTNGGSSFTKLTSGLPASGFNRVCMDISKSNPSVLYAAFINGGSVVGLYKTTNGGTSWTQLTSTPNFCNPQCWYDAYVAVDPANANIVYLGGVDPRYATAGVLKTTNGGTSWTEISNAGGSQLHPDHHVMAFGAGGVIWEGNDGGVWKSTNNGASWINVNADLQITQHYNIVQHPNFPERYLGGTQDNGTPERTTSTLIWPQLQAGDGGFSVYDFTNTTRRYTTYVYLRIYRWVNSSSSNITGSWSSDSVNWIAPLVGDPNSSTTLVAGTNRIWRTTNAASSSVSWTAISTTTVSNGGTINAIAVANGASNTIYSGSSNGRVYVTTNASTWNNRSTGLPSGQISDIIISPSDPGTAYVAFYNTSGARIFRTTNYGVNWTNVTGTLPSGVGAQALAVDWDWNPSPSLYVGSGAGVYVSLDGGGTWIKDGADLPNVNVQDLVIDPVRRTIAAGTYGRGVWRSNLPSACPADFDGSGFVDLEDYTAFVQAFEAGDQSADFDGSGFVDLEDFTAFVLQFESGC